MKGSLKLFSLVAMIGLFLVCPHASLAVGDGGYDITSSLWAKAILQVSGAPVTLVWQVVGTDITPSGDQVISGYFYADPNDFAFGSQYNPELFVKIYIAKSGWCNIAFNHVTVDNVTIYSAHKYAGAAQQTGTAMLSKRLVEHQYNGVAIQNTPQANGVLAPHSTDSGYIMTSGLWAKAILQPGIGPVTLIWKEVGSDTTPSGDKVVSGYFYADPGDFAYGSEFNPEVFVKIYIAKSGWCNIAFNHVTVDNVGISSAHNYAGFANQSGTASLAGRLVEDQYDGVETDLPIPDDYTPRPVVPGETTPESSGKVTITKVSSSVSLSDGTQIRFPGMGQGGSITLALDRVTNTIDMGTSSIATSGSMRTLTVDAVAYNGTDESSTFSPILTIPKKEIGSLNVNSVNMLRVSIDPETGLEERYFFPVFLDETGNLTFKDWLLPADILEEQVTSVQKLGSLIRSKATAPKIIKYSPITMQNGENTKVSAQLVRMVPTKGYAWKRKPISSLLSADEQKELKKPVQNVVIFVHGHNEAEKIGFEQRNSAAPWLFDYKQQVWNYMYDKFLNDFSNREGCTVFYEFIYPSWRSIYKHLNEELARKVKEALAPQLKNGMKFNLFIVAHSMGGVVARSGLMLFEAPLKDNLQRLVTWGSPHHGSPLNTLRFALSSPALASRQNWAAVKALSHFGAKAVFPAQGVLDLRWTADIFDQGERLQLDKVFRWYGDSADPKAWEKWNTGSGTMLYNDDLWNLNLADDMGTQYAFLYGITNEGLKLQDWSEFGVASLEQFNNLSAIGQGATLAYLLMGNPTKQFLGADLGDSDGVAPVISMAGYHVTNNAPYVGHADHEQYFNSSVFAPKTADETYKAMDFSNQNYASPEIKLTSPTSGQTFKANEEIPVAGQLLWPGDAKPGKRIKQLQVKSSSSGKSITLQGPTITDDGNFSGKFNIDDLKGYQKEPPYVLTIIVQFKDDTELEIETSVNTQSDCDCNCNCNFDYSMSVKYEDRVSILYRYNNKLHGPECFWYDELRNQLDSTGCLKNGYYHGPYRSWYRNGNKYVECNYLDGELNGIYRHWYESGNKKVESNYLNGKLHGVFTNWYENGNKMSEGTNTNGNSTGIWYYWYEDGSCNYVWDYDKRVSVPCP
jgi:hypothetical protein